MSNQGIEDLVAAASSKK